MFDVVELNCRVHSEVLPQFLSHFLSQSQSNPGFLVPWLPGAESDSLSAFPVLGGMNELLTIRDIPAPPKRPEDAHKGTFGTVIVVGGTVTMPGAAALCAASALRAGAGLVKIASTREVLAVAIAIEPSATGILLREGEDDAAGIDAADERGSAVLAVGPGMGGSDAAQRLVMQLLRGQRAMVLDADGLNLLARHGRPRPAGGPTLVMTPHPGEFARLAKPLGIEESPTDPTTRPLAAARLAQAHHAVVLLKGRHTVVSDGRRIWMNTTGNSALATAGMGDVLTGLIASLMAQGMNAFDAACLGAHLHGLAADLWRDQHGPSGMTARDLAQLLPDAFQHDRRARTVDER